MKRIIGLNLFRFTAFIYTLLGGYKCYQTRVTTKKYVILITTKDSEE